MGSLDVYYLPEHDESPVVVATEDEVDALIDAVAAQSPSTAPILMDVHLSGDPYAQGLDVGVAAERGLIRYAGRDWPLGVVSTGAAPAGGNPVPYFYMGHWREFPSNAEIPLATIKAAIKEFMSTDGGRPASVKWQEVDELAGQ
ncbi:Imm1 family immunity protein [Actinokineospora sp. HUAS TT18]|uniref:Imm1 family immunity protein n=1 Tax=Actinokineospora sp. HUAS TT18 TaxID=3447451 RepID=UPI003F51BF77